MADRRVYYTPKPTMHSRDSSSDFRTSYPSGRYSDEQSDSREAPREHRDRMADSDRRYVSSTTSRSSRVEVIDRHPRIYDTEAPRSSEASSQDYDYIRGHRHRGREGGGWGGGGRWELGGGGRGGNGGALEVAAGVTLPMNEIRGKKPQNEDSSLPHIDGPNDGSHTKNQTSKVSDQALASPVASEGSWEHTRTTKTADGGFEDLSRGRTRTVSLTDSGYASAHTSLSGIPSELTDQIFHILTQDVGLSSCYAAMLESSSSREFRNIFKDHLHLYSSDLTLIARDEVEKRVSRVIARNAQRYASEVVNLYDNQTVSGPSLLQSVPAVQDERERIAKIDKILSKLPDQNPNREGGEDKAKITYDKLKDFLIGGDPFYRLQERFRQSRDLAISNSPPSSYKLKEVSSAQQTPHPTQPVEMQTSLPHESNPHDIGNSNLLPKDSSLQNNPVMFNDMLEFDLESQEVKGKPPESLPRGFQQSKSIRRLRWVLRMLHLIKQEEPIQVGMVRLRWQSTSGRHFYFDVSQDSDIVDAQASTELPTIRRSNTSPDLSMSNTDNPNQSSRSTQATSVASAPQDAPKLLNVRQNHPRKPLPHHSKPAFKSGWVILCAPRGASLIISHEALNGRVTDRNLFEMLRKAYEKRRPRWRRILELRAVANIEIVHFRLHEVNQAFSQPWEWPPDLTQSGIGWSCVVPADLKPNRPEVDSKWLKALWNGESMMPIEQAGVPGPQEKPPLSILLRISSYFHSILGLDPAPGPQVTISRNFWTFDRIPKRVGSILMLLDHHTEYLKGWGVEVEEGFHISWEISLLVCLLGLGAIGLAVGLAHKNHNLAYFGVVGLPLPLLGYLLTVYITASKDNKA